ncbi:MAG: cyanophycin synthetase [Planctomycetota bacterium]
MHFTWKIFTDPGETRLRAALERLDLLVDWERRDRAPGGARLMRVDLRPAADLAARVGNPERAWRAVHVAGTKGKGSTAALVAEGLRRCGRAVGVYASPHVERIEERIRLDGRSIAGDPFARALEGALAAREAAVRERSSGAGATWFDVLTIAAFLAFRAARLEWVVVECGLGGRLDSTNVIVPELCIVTSIALEHTAILGSTRAAIAGEKAGIFKAGVPVVSGVGPAGDEAADELSRRAAALGVTFRRVAAAEAGWVGERNAALAGAALEELGARVPSLACAGRPAGAWLLDAPTRAAARLPGRLERTRRRGIPVVFDGAHVASSLEAVLGELAAEEAHRGPATVVLALGKDKDAAAMLKVLAGRADSVLCTTAGIGPYRAPAELAGLAREIGLPARAVGDPESAYNSALAAARGGGWVLVTGSLHLVGVLRSRS